METTPDAGATQGLTQAIQQVLPALEQFLRFEDEDRAASEFPQWRAALDRPLPEEGAGAEATLRLLSETVIPHGLRTGAPGFAGWVTTMPTIVPAVTAFSASFAGPQRWWIQAFNTLEQVALEWLKQLLGIPATYQGTFNSGGSIANLIALGAARQWACEERGVDASRDGVAAIPKPRMYSSTQVHHVVHRAAGVLGLGRRAVVELPCDSEFRLEVGALRERLRRDAADGCTPIAVIASAGTVNTGAIDPLREILQVCREQGVWLHVDGAYGGFGILDPAVAPRFDGLAEADSIAVDPHKWLAVPLGCGSTFVRDREILGRAFTLEPAEYLERVAGHAVSGTSQFENLGHPLDFNLEQSARSRGATVWAALLEMGAEGMRARVRRHNAFARPLETRVRASADLEMLAPVTLSICCFRFAPPELRRSEGSAPVLNDLNREILRRLHQEHHHIPSGTEVDGNFAIRPCYINPRTTPQDVDGLADAVERIGAVVWREHRRAAAEP
ncbi:MAG: pyridoxal phosphate-dependent decarboxylase family protein [Anaerolineales bacterium]